jgi:NAD(P)-dependent dehydrogenase (short-subunit alcohol dehydrogenase family)
MSSFDKKVAVIAGAGSGMALARNLAKKGAKLALSDIDAEGLADMVRQAEALGAEVKSDLLNVAEREAVLTYADDVVGHFGRVTRYTATPALPSVATSRSRSSRTSTGSWTLTSGAQSPARSVSAACDRVGRRPRGQHLELVRADRCARSKCIQRVCFGGPVAD